MKTAQAQLAWAAENAKDEPRDLARLRLAAVLLDEKAYDEALKQLAAEPPAFAARFDELKGDVLAAQGKKPEAARPTMPRWPRAKGDEGRGGGGRAAAPET